MKLMFLTDIHGSAFYFNQSVEAIKRENPDMICLLGDLLYHGPRNPLPKDYDPKVVLAGLNEMKDKLVAVRGNCDSEVDQMVLEFPIMSDYHIVLYNGRKLFLTHGHLYNESNLPELNAGDCVIHGHTHVPVAKEVNGIHVLNPGSTSLPKQETPHSYGIIEEDKFTAKTLEGEAFLSYSL